MFPTMLGKQRDFYYKKNTFITHFTVSKGFLKIQEKISCKANKDIIEHFFFYLTLTAINLFQTLTSCQLRQFSYYMSTSRRHVPLCCHRPLAKT